MRSFSAAILVPAVLLDVWLGGVWFKLFAALVAILMAYEWTVIAHERSSAQFALHAAAGLCGAFLPADIGPAGAIIGVLVLAAFSILILGFQGRSRNPWTMLGVLYVGFSSTALVQIRGDGEFGVYALVWILVIVWAADSFAYFFGRTLGGPKLAPVVSPNKTWAGLLGAMAGAAVASMVFCAVTEIGSIVFMALFAGGLAIVEQGGDLFKSAFKRHYGVKDTGRLIPGHGGVIDRVDGLVAVAMISALIGVLRAGPEATGRGLLVW